ncbi:MAG: type II toxin-antitoxin system VapC family toxin [Candidatus Tectomicrobia bacterium]|nr:type II toxin-antitoxin system VapC family toxin [Candidatus Tectomicrobia bacterium]
MRILLDTRTFLWMIIDAEHLSDTAREVFREPANDVFLSAVSAWEITLKYGQGKLPLPQFPERFVPEQRDRHGIDALSLDEQSIFHLHRLPALHRDPFDRMLACQAIEHGLIILTPDHLITQYPVRTLW